MSDTPTGADRATARVVEKSYANVIARQLGTIAGRLRDLADSAEREARDLTKVPGPGRATYASVVSRVQHEILWGLANLNLSSLTDNAQQADEYRIKGE